MASPDGPRLAPIAYLTPLVSTGALLAAGHRLSPLGLLGCALIVLCAGGVVLEQLPRRRAREPTSARHGRREPRRPVGKPTSAEG